MMSTLQTVLACGHAIMVSKFDLALHFLVNFRVFRYSSEEELRERLAIALREGSEGFGFA